MIEILVTPRNNIEKIGSIYAFLVIESENIKNEWKSPFRRGRGGMVLWGSTFQMVLCWWLEEFYECSFTTEKHTTSHLSVDIRHGYLGSSSFIVPPNCRDKDKAPTGIRFNLMFFYPLDSCFLLFGSWTPRSCGHLQCVLYLPFLMLLSCWCSHWSRLASCCIYITPVCSL